MRGHDYTQDIAQKILTAIEGIHYGSLEIIIHDSKVVQIERREKVRLDQDARLNGNNATRG